jgi:hypothetical protein
MASFKCACIIIYLREGHEWAKNNSKVHKPISSGLFAFAFLLSSLMTLTMRRRLSLQDKETVVTTFFYTQ